jgi:hypothetical protein
MRGFENKFFYLSYAPMRFFEAAPGRAHVIGKIILPVLRFLHQNETIAG